MATAGDLITRRYRDLLGVDFTNRKDEVSINNSPDALNVWKNYKSNKGKCIETRPDIELIEEYDNTIYGLFFYTINSVEHMIIHCGTSLYDYNTKTKTKTKIKAEGMNPHLSYGFICNNIFFIKDGINYLEYDGQTLKEVEGTVPLTSISRKPMGGGRQYQDVNVLTSKRRNSFIADGESTEYLLDAKELTNVDKVWVNDALQATTAYTVDNVLGKVTFNTAPAKPNTEGQDNVVIEFTKVVKGHRDRINKCTLLQVFDDRIFFSGNQDYPNYIFHCEFNGDLGSADPRYVSDTDYQQEGIDTSKVKAMVAGNNALWVFKEPNELNTAIFYHTPSSQLNENTNDYETVYPSNHSSISTGCIGKAVNFNDDICFFSPRGMEGMTSTDVTTEQILAHRSTFVDSRLLNEKNYKNMLLEEWEGYLLVIIDNHIYLADSRALSQLNGHYEYNWFYWELDKNVTCTRVKDGILYLCIDKAIYTLTKVATNINSYWTTLEDEFKYPQYQKTTNKKGCIVDIEGEQVTISVKTDNKIFETIGTYKNTKGYVVPKIKKKKWKSIQLKFSSNKPFSISESTLEAYIGSYVKR